ncbi:hypothetical protein I6N96_06175 [Enterococcus sp. BWM-S5]|uniref:DUF443 family protein n=1 Tax=Enterococcus larvae TaxID=2794352 RepID=A0ABS4CH29_9ENTE|nr:hypothetical protein [Enterococcus larvae]MBP1045861.1 hypothetical protein [Enterococcus larvae]
MEIRTTFSNNWYILRKDGKSFLLDMTGNRYFNKSAFRLWLTKKKAYILAEEEADILVREKLFTQAPPSWWSMLAFFSLLYFLERIHVSTSFSLRLSLLILAPIALTIILGIRSKKEGQQIEQLLNKKIIYADYVQVAFNDRKEKIRYIFRRFLAFIIFILLTILTGFAFFITGFATLLAFYAVLSTLPFGTIVPCPANDRCKNIDFIQVNEIVDEVKSIDL